MAHLGKRCKNSLIYYFVAGVIALIRLLPLTWVPLVGKGMGKLAYLVGRPERRRALANLSRVFPEQSQHMLDRRVRSMFTHLGQNALECVLMTKLKKRLGSLASPVSFSPGSLECLLHAEAQGRGILFITAHLGNWELMAAEVARHARVTVLSKPSYDMRFTNMINVFRQKNGVQSLEVTRPGHLLQAKLSLAEGNVLGVLLDQPVPHGPLISFLGQPAPTSIVVAALARWTGAPVLFGFIYRQKSGAQLIQVHQVNIEKLNSCACVGGGRSPKEVVRQKDIAATQLFSEAIEKAILAHPDQWVWSLDRWRSTESRVLSRHNANVVPSPGN